MEQRVSLITLGVADLARSREFYENILGWKSAPSPPEIVFFDLNGIVFSLYRHENLAKETDDAVASPGPYRGFALAHNVASKEEVDSILSALKEKGVTIEKEPAEQHWGGYSGYFSDPDGHKWEVAYNPFWTVDSEGRVFTFKD